MFSKNNNILMINSPYPHFSQSITGYVKDETAVLPIGPLYAAELMERKYSIAVDLFDCQLNDLWNSVNLKNYDSFGISIMGPQNIVPAIEIYYFLKNYTTPDKIYFGGQGTEKLSISEFNKLFPGAQQVQREDLYLNDTWQDVTIEKQISKIPLAVLKEYLSNEVTLLTTQGCRYGCAFCAAENNQQEYFFDTRQHLDFILRKVCELDISELDIYCTSLDFFQSTLYRSEVEKLIKMLEDIVELKEKYRVKLNLRALTRADSFIASLKNDVLWDLVKAAGFYKFGFGADGAASIDILKAMRRGTSNLKHDIINSFELCEKHGMIPEMLYVFGIPEDNEDSLRATKDFCTGLLREFNSSQYRGFPAKNEIPGNYNWKNKNWTSSVSYQKLFEDPSQFLNLGYETLVNYITHPDKNFRKMVNKYAIEMSYIAHQLGRVQSFLTIPIAESDGHELMDEESFEKLKEIVRIYIPGHADNFRLKTINSHRPTINRYIPKDR